MKIHPVVEQEEEILNDLPLPMLARLFRNEGDKFQWPGYAQPKLDGVRALYRPGIGFWSRQGNIFSPEILEPLELGGDLRVIIDGELVLPREYHFQDFISALRRYGDLSDKIEYHVFDLILSEGFEVRHQLLSEVFNFYRHPRWRIVPTFSVGNLEAVEEYHDSFVHQGYEGTIVRALGQPYAIGKRVSQLLKVKDTKDDEFLVSRIVEGEGKDAGAAIFICHTKLGQEFRARPAMPYAVRRYIFQNQGEYIGKQVTVRYQALTKEGIPRFPRAIRMRDYE